MFIISGAIIAMNAALTCGLVSLMMPVLAFLIGEGTNKHIAYRELRFFYNDYGKNGIELATNKIQYGLKHTCLSTNIHNLSKNLL